MARPKILMAGSFIMDHTATTNVFPKEGETVMGNTFSKAPGGKGDNQAVQMARLGADVTVFGKLGNDSEAEEIIGCLEEAGIDTSLLLRGSTFKTGSCMIIVEQAENKQAANRILVLPGANMEITAEDTFILKDRIADFDMVVLQLEIPMEINARIAEYAFEKHVPVMLNSAPSAPIPDELFSHLAFLSPNEHEACDLTGIRIAHEGTSFDEAAARAACRALKERGAKNVLITIGQAGAVLDTEKDGFFHSPCAENVTAVDPTAAGDSFIGAFCIGVCCGFSWEDTLTFANHTAALTVSRLGAMPSLPTLSRVEAFLKDRRTAVPDFSMLR